ncbi:MAG: hypothetical protein OXJ53_04355 [Gammaproteobacteria bacterium]|nr:hypothetical protein [Gammaproteobacteria bacterium]MDE0273401.1 hypothetical protein [Gammaproteobacteria bacterium]
MNKLSKANRAQILSMLVEGVSLLVIARVTDASFNTTLSGCRLPELPGGR